MSDPKGEQAKINISYRFEVSDKICGVVEFFRTFEQAKEFGKRHKKDHEKDDEKPEVVIFDRMASKSKRRRGDDLIVVYEYI